MPDIDSISLIDNHNFLACTEDAPAGNTPQGEKQNRQKKAIKRKISEKKVEGDYPRLLHPITQKRCSSLYARKYAR